MSLKNKQRALLNVLSKKFSKEMIIVDAKEVPPTWTQYPTYTVRYEYAWDRGNYYTMEYLPSEKTEIQVKEALIELDYQAEGLEFPEQK